ncbi:hypothetical protein [Salipiger sp. PrR007]|uniref:hypothetical protein n=1 Tax=Salipiger sp. PrR007 TaxID=2706884 RepID=UPI0013B64A18|nr:hypothetical protein [Salipiger sp. PrR007]NDW33808.1 hypothetical protein [Salipiger sp. PrR007]
MPKLHLAVDNTCDQPAVWAQRLSRPKILDRFAVRVTAPEVWCRFLHAEFRNPEEVAVHFEVRFSTACNWWNATNRPSADKVLIAMVEHGAALSTALEAEMGERRAA